MSVEYTAILLDEHDWPYIKCNKREAIDIIHSIYAGGVVYSQFGMIVIDCRKNPPEEVKSTLKYYGIHYDAIYFINSSNLLEIYKA